MLQAGKIYQDKKGNSYKIVYDISDNFGVGILIENEKVVRFPLCRGYKIGKSSNSAECTWDEKGNIYYLNGKPVTKNGVACRKPHLIISEQ